VTSIYRGVDAVQQGQLFWATFTHHWPMPFQLEGHGGAVLDDTAAAKMLVVAVAESPRDEDRLRVQLLVSTVLELEVSLTREQQEFICGTHRGRAVDEVSAVDVLSLHAPICGEWLHFEDNDARRDGEESEHG
jgi:hypothetical protein